jgi:histidinol-phosphate aminotransferase
MGFVFTDSKANFVFAKHPSFSGECLYKQLKEKGVLVRHFGSDRISDYLRITVGNEMQIKKLLTSIRSILEEEK